MPPILALLLIASGGAAAERARSAAEATVFIRVVANAHIELEEFGVRQTIDREHVEVQTGSGFVISPYGYVLTNQHVIAVDDDVVSRGTMKAKLTVTQPKVEVCFSQGPGGGGSCSEASVYASDPALDLAILYVSVPNLPYVALGDSDVVIAGQPVEALGYPFGRRVEVGLPVEARNVVPEITTTPGAISATRNGEAGERRYLQVTNAVNPGNSGGPIVDRDGFAVGVITMKLRDAAGIAFAIPVNQAKDFLELHGVDQQLPARRIRLGPLQALEGKGVVLRLPEGLSDVSPFRARIETDGKLSPVVLRIDRALSPWAPKQIEQALIGSQSFEAIVATATDNRPGLRPGDTRSLAGRINGTEADGTREIGMEYAILDLGAEKLIARYIGPLEQIAFNASVLRESLIGLDGRLLVSGTVDPIETFQWSATAMSDGQTRVPFPAGWTVEARGPTACPGLPQANASLAAAPAQDFTIGMRAAVWTGADVTPEQAASACSPRGASTTATYASRVEWLGVSYAIDGAFTRLGAGKMIQLEVIAPADKSAFSRALLAAWIKTIRSTGLP